MFVNVLCDYDGFKSVALSQLLFLSCCFYWDYNKISVIELYKKPIKIRYKIWIILEHHANISKATSETWTLWIQTFSQSYAN